MFSTCRSLQTGLILLALGACSKQPEPAAAPAAPLVAAAPQANEPKAVAQTLEGKINAAGLAATYQATFGANEALRIVEQRADSKSGEYEFRGARLLHYSGGGLTRPSQIELAFDLSGAMTLAEADAGPVSSQEIGSVRERAQLLRSHALAQKTTRDHQ